MFCTNCGAKVDDSAKFCPVCGNKLRPDEPSSQEASPTPPQPQPNVASEAIEKTTYGSTTSNENQITNTSEPVKKQGKFAGIITSIKSIKPGKKKEASPEPKIEVPEGKSELSKEDPAKSLESRIEYEDEMQPSYYGYEPTDDRKRKDLRHRDNPNMYSYDQSIAASIGQKMNQNASQNQGYSQSQTFESNLGQNAQSSQYPQYQQSQNNYVTYDDIPNEHMEARIARQLRQNSTNYDQEAAQAGNIAAVIRQHQPQNQYMPQEAPSVNYQPQAPLAYQVDQQPAFNQTQAQAYEPQPQQQVAYLEPPVDPVDEPVEEKGKFKFNPLYLLPLVLLLIAVVIFFFLKNRTPDDVEIDLSNYVEVTFTGDDGQASPTANLNSSKLLADYGGQIAYTNKDRKDESYSSPANQFITELENSTQFNFSKDGNIANGEEVTVVANVSDASLEDDYNVKLLNTIKSVIAEGLNTQAYDDPFNYINVDFAGESPNITLTTSLTDGAPDFMSIIEIAPAKTSELSEGEEVNVSLIFDEEELFNSYGVRLNPTDKIYVVPGEVEPEEGGETEEETTEANAPELTGGFITTVDGLDEELLGTLKYDAGELIRNTFEERSFTQIESIDYLGAITGSDSNNADLQNRVMLIYEVTANENYEGKYVNNFKYYSFVEYQNVKDTKGEDGSFYSAGPMTTDNEIFHKFFVEDDYTYYEIPYYGFAFLEEVLSRVNNALSGLSIDDSIAVDATQYFTTSDGVAGEYQGNGTRLTLREDGSLRYKLDQRVHQGSWQDSAGSLSLTIEGVNVDTPITATFENGAINVPEQGEIAGQTFNKMQMAN